MKYIMYMIYDLLIEVAVVWHKSKEDEGRWGQVGIFFLSLSPPSARSPIPVSHPCLCLVPALHSFYWPLGVSFLSIAVSKNLTEPFANMRIVTSRLSCLPVQYFWNSKCRTNCFDKSVTSFRKKDH